MCGLVAIGVFCDRHDLYMQAYDYYTANNHGDPQAVFGNGAIAHGVYFMHPGHLGQWQESARDQGHATLGMSLGGSLLEMAWNQGDDLYGMHNNRFLAAAEYVARSNLKDANGNTYPMPFARQRDTSRPPLSLWWGANQSTQAYRNAWEPIYNHYVNRMGLAAPNVARMMALCEPNFGSSNCEDMVFSTLIHRRAPYAGPLNAPSGVTAHLSDGKVVLSWWGSVGATSYEITRSDGVNGPYEEVATLHAGDLLTWTDAVAKGVWFYQVTAVGGGEGASAEAVRIAVPGEAQLSMPLNGWANTETYGARTTPKGDWTIVEGKMLDGATWGAGRHDDDKALALDGRGASFELPQGLFTGLEDFTLALWVYTVVHRRDSCVLYVGTDERACMRISPQARGGGLRYAICAGGRDDEQAVEASMPLPTSRWAHVAVAQQGTTVRLYVDGSEVASADNILLAPRQLGDQVRLLGKSPGMPHFYGRIQGLRIYSGALTPAEIAALAA
jgi:hypothetical protein